jgi:hypothetical protein
MSNVSLTSINVLGAALKALILVVISDQIIAFSILITALKCFSFNTSKLFSTSLRSIDSSSAMKLAFLNLGSFLEVTSSSFLLQTEGMTERKMLRSVT